MTNNLGKTIARMRQILANVVELVDEIDAVLIDLQLIVNVVTLAQRPQSQSQQRQPRRRLRPKCGRTWKNVYLATSDISRTACRGPQKHLRPSCRKPPRGYGKMQRIWESSHIQDLALPSPRRP